MHLPSSLPVPFLAGGEFITHPSSIIGLHNELVSQIPSIGGIFKLCENHPRMKDCICAAFPNSKICNDTYCLNHPNFYECSPNYCISNPGDTEACKCKWNPDNLDCKCKLNPISKECFCLRYSDSKLCLPDFCMSYNNTNQIFCICKKNPLSQECRPAYCYENKFDLRCKCLLQPEDDSCLCYNYPSNIKCKSFDYELNKYNEHEEVKELKNLDVENKKNFTKKVIFKKTKLLI